MKKTIIFMLLFSTLIVAQNNVTINGFIRDAETGEALIGANVYIPGQTYGAATNQYGFYSFTLPEGTYKVLFHFVGYTKKEIELTLSKNQAQDMELKPERLETEVIIVSAEKEDQNVTEATMGTIKIEPSQIREIPVIFGEQDILKTIQLMPGVTASTEGSSGFHVRGGGDDENLILLDEAPVYNSSHLMGLFSVFNSDAINSAKLIKGGGPPEYGGRLSSVFDIKMKEGNRKNYSSSGGIGLISSRLAFEGPINDGLGSFILSGRRTYADLVMKAASDDFEDFTLYFYDLNMKANYRLGQNDIIYLSGYSGRDVLGFDDRFGINWGNSTATLRWNHLFSDKIFSNTSLIYSNFDYVISFENGGNLTDIKSGIEDINLKQNFYYFDNPQNQFNGGFDINYHTFIPGKISAEGDSPLNDLTIEKKYAWEAAFYIGHEWKPFWWLSFNYGSRYTAFTQIGPGTVYDFDEDDDVVSETEYSDSESIKSYSGFEPRFTMNAMLNRESSIKFDYSRTRQYIHLISNTSGGPSMEVWMPSTTIVKPSVADQLSIGYFRNFADNNFESSLELYYKDMQDLTDYQDGADLLLNQYVESQLVFGGGYSYGAEFLFKKNKGNLTGWLGYTWSKTQREFPDINNGKVYSASNDRTHDLSLTAMYALSPKLHLSANWVYQTGTAVTFPSGKYKIDGETVNYYAERNSYRMPDYHRLDLGLTYNFSHEGRFESNLNFSIYNAYGQKNAYSIYFRENEDDPTLTEAVKVYLFTYFPSISYNFKW